VSVSVRFNVFKGVGRVVCSWCGVTFWGKVSRSPSRSSLGSRHDEYPLGETRQYVGKLLSICWWCFACVVLAVL